MTCAAQNVIIEPDAAVGFQDCMSALQNASGGSIVSTRGETAGQMMEVPYNIIVDNWVTGINVHSLSDNEELSFFYVNNGQPYLKVILKIDTSMVDSTFLINDKTYMADVQFKSPTTLVIFSKTGGFTLSQFIMNGDEGFGYQTFNSK